MKKTVILILTIISTIVQVNAQVGINADGSSPDGSAMLDVRSTTKGMLVTRMTIAQRDAIVSPATGLLVFCIDNGQYYSNKGVPLSPNWVMISSQWMANGSDISFSNGFVGIGTSSPLLNLQVQGRIGSGYGSSSSAAYVFGSGSENTGLSSPDSKTIAFIINGSESGRFYWNGNFGIGITAPAYKMDVAGDINASGNLRQNGIPVTFSQWATNGASISYNSGNTGIGITNPNNSAVLDLTSAGKGFLPPRMNTAQRAAIVSPAEGLVIYNTDDKTLNVFNGTSWGLMSQAPCGQPFTDPRDGKTYNTLLIGTQCWLKENLNVGTMIVAASNQTNNNIIEKHCYNDLESNCSVYGGLYEWGELMGYSGSSAANPSGLQGICPTGWHVPSLAEWCQMETYLDPTVNCAGEMWQGTNIGGMLKESGTIHWSAPNSGATNSSGFTALPAGNSVISGLFANINNYTYFWTATENTPSYAYVRILAYNNQQIYQAYDYKSYGYTSRCVRN
jgi:uncharacterized protein (TIGR02145 family)